MLKENMKSILLIVPYGGVGGMERLAFSFYNFYKSQGHVVKAIKFIKLETDIINFGEDELFFSNRDYIDMSRKERLFFNFKIPFLLRKIIKKYKITHSIAYGDPTNLYSSLTFTKEYKIGSIHALKSVEMSNNSTLTKLTKFGLKYTYKRLNKLVCISEAIKEDLINSCFYSYKKNLKVIYNPHDIDEINKRALEDLESDFEIDLFNNNKVLLFLGRLSTQKSPWHLINSFSLLIKKQPEIKLVFIGDGDFHVQDYLNKLILKYKLSENIVFLGRKNNPYKYLYQSNALVLSSHYEGTPNVIVEAIALNVPIVSSYCTKGIVELMSLQNHPIINENFEVEAGIITPNLFKGKLGIPVDDTLVNEEILLSEAMNNIFLIKFKDRLKYNSEKLLLKFNLEVVAKQYLQN